MAERDHPQINVNQTYISQNGQTGAAGDQYVGLDQFGRVVDQNWYDTTTQTSTDNFQYGYDQDGDVLYKQNLVDAAMSELYQYDNLGQLTSFARGTLNSNDTGISGTPSRTQSWTPDALGNFTGVTTNGTTQTRSANQQNEYTSISGSGTITYDANGNITADGSGNTYVYDAWNQLVAVKNNGTTLASYSYDGLGRRIAQTEGGTTTDLYYSAADQVLEEDVGGVAQARNVWSPVYVNALVLRDQSSQHNGVLDQRLYVQQDANWNVTALLDTSGNVLERYQYDPYGAVTVLSPSWSVQSSSNYNVPYGFQGMRYDWTVSLNFADKREDSPTLMRWLETDPLGFAAGDTNLYRYTYNAPTNLNDPSGDSPTIITGAAGFVIGAVGGGIIAGFTNGWTWQNIGKGATVGAVAGGVAGLTLGLAGPGIASAAGSLVGGGTPGAIFGGGAAGAVSGVAGNVVGQGFAIGMGWQNGFSWPQVIISGGVGFLVGAGGAVLSILFVRPTSRPPSSAGVAPPPSGEPLEIELPPLMEPPGGAIELPPARPNVPGLPRGPGASLNPPPSMGRLPPGWNPNWEWGPPSGEAPGGWRWWDPNGVEWRWHAPDQWHPEGHWDYNPWDVWNSSWQNVPQCAPAPGNP